MTEEKAKKKAVRQRMIDTGEPYNVARRAIGTPRSNNHLIDDQETKRIAEQFFGVSPWLGAVTWGEIIIGPGAEYLADFEGSYGQETELSEDQRWSWSVKFTDPSGQNQELSHERVLEGIRGLVFSDAQGADGWQLLRLRQWFTEPGGERRKLDLGPDDCSRICQQALYGRPVFSASLGSEKFDLFDDQR